MCARVCVYVCVHLYLHVHMCVYVCDFRHQWSICLQVWLQSGLIFEHILLVTF